MTSLVQNSATQPFSTEPDSRSKSSTSIQRFRPRDDVDPLPGFNEVDLFGLKVGATRTFKGSMTMRMSSTC